jgi:putative endonuclease
MGQPAHNPNNERLTSRNKNLTCRHVIPSPLKIGRTNDLKRRVFEHKQKLQPGFCNYYNVNKLVYYETSESIESAILREKQIKDTNRKKKLQLINGMNKDWRDLWYEL